MLVGGEHGGWGQVMSELALERSGPERYLSSIQVIIEFLRVIGPEPEEPSAEPGGAFDGTALVAAANVFGDRAAP